LLQGILEDITTSRVNLVNADLLAKNRGLRISEVIIRSEGRCVAFQSPGHHVALWACPQWHTAAASL